MKTIATVAFLAFVIVTCVVPSALLAIGLI